MHYIIFTVFTPLCQHYLYTFNPELDRILDNHQSGITIFRTRPVLTRLWSWPANSEQDYYAYFQPLYPNTQRGYLSWRNSRAFSFSVPMGSARAPTPRRPGKLPGYLHFSTGDMFRALVARVKEGNASELELRIDKTMKSGGTGGRSDHGRSGPAEPGEPLRCRGQFQARNGLYSARRVAEKPQAGGDDLRALSM